MQCIYYLNKKHSFEIKLFHIYICIFLKINPTSFALLNVSISTKLRLLNKISLFFTVEISVSKFSKPSSLQTESGLLLLTGLIYYSFVFTVIFWIFFSFDFFLLCPRWIIISYFEVSWSCLLSKKVDLLLRNLRFKCANNSNFLSERTHRRTFFCWILLPTLGQQCASYVNILKRVTLNIWEK